MIHPGATDAGLDIKTLPCINLQRPTFYDEKAREFWKTFHDLIRTSEVQVVVNSVFGFVDDCVQKPDGKYSGGGMGYRFWFVTEEDRVKFIAFVKEKMNITLF